MPDRSADPASLAPPVVDEGQGRGEDGWVRNEVTFLWDVRLLPGYAWLDPDPNPWPRFRLLGRTER